MFNLLFLVRSIRILTFPGVFVHELAHEMACRILGVQVEGVRYFVFDGETLGSVSHAPTHSVYKTFFISMAPLPFGILIGMAILIPTWIHVAYFESASHFELIKMWVAVSILLHAAPSRQDGYNVIEEIRERPTSERGKYSLIRVAAGFFTMPDLGVLSLVFTWLCIAMIPKFI